MANKNYYGCAEAKNGKADIPMQKGSTPSSAMPMKTAAWPSGPGKAQPRDRSNGVPKKGWFSDFHHKKEGF